MKATRVINTINNRIQRVNIREPMLAFLLQIFQAILLIPIEYDDLYNLIQKQNKNEKFAPI